MSTILDPKVVEVLVLSLIGSPYCGLRNKGRRARFFSAEMFKFHRFIFGNGEEQPPTAFIWEEEEIPLTNGLLELMTTEERGG